MSKKVFITGGTGYIGTRLIKKLLADGFEVTALVRKGSEAKLPMGCKAVYGNALDAESFKSYIPDSGTFVHLVGVAHPSPSKKQQFIDIDLASIKASVSAAKGKPLHFVYISVAQPNNIMKDYTEVRIQGEALVKENFVQVSILRPFYVLGPGHYWPIILMPFYFIARFVPSWQQKAETLGLVSINNMVNALVKAVINPPTALKIWEVKDIKDISNS